MCAKSTILRKNPRFSLKPLGYIGSVFAIETLFQSSSVQYLRIIPFYHIRLMSVAE